MQCGYTGDRFYLNRNDSEQSGSTKNFSTDRRKGTSEMQAEIPSSSLNEYYFARKEYVKQVYEREVIDCVIISTYRLELECLVKEFPMLFHQQHNIPTLVLHGDKGRNYHLLYGGYAPTRTNQAKFEDIALKEENEEYNISTPTKSLNVSELNFQSGRLTIPPNMQIYEVTPTIYRDLKTKKISYAAGVHHSKYMFVFTNRGLHVIITTANFTTNKTIDASWIQFFPKRISSSQYLEENTDFGMVLTDFLEKQSNQIRRVSEEGEDFIDGDSSNIDFTILQWIQKHTGSDDIDDAYDFSKATVKLVSTVPSRQPLPPLCKSEIDMLYSQLKQSGEIKSFEKCAKCKIEEAKLLPEDSIQYGSLRVKEILKNKNNRWPRPFRPDDTVFVQPTSIGQNLNISFIDQYLSSLMPEQYWDDAPDQFNRSENWKCLWPSHRYMKDVHNKLREEAAHEFPEEDHHTEELSFEPKVNILAGGPPEILFFNPKSFALMEPDIQTQFYSYRTNNSIIEKHEIPHIKSYTRIYNEDQHGGSDHSGEGKCRCYKVAWTLLTSACLSKGAQGEIKPYSMCKECNHIRRGYWEYKNFELGVMFKSSKAKQYYAMCEDCPLHPSIISSASDYSSSKTTSKCSHQEIFLPYPFDLKKAESYCDDRIQLKMLPFFRPMHDIYKYLVNLAQEQLIKDAVGENIGDRNEFGRRVFRAPNSNPAVSTGAAAAAAAPSLEAFSVKSVRPQARRLSGRFKEEPIVLFTQNDDERDLEWVNQLIHDANVHTVTMEKSTKPQEDYLLNTAGLSDQYSIDSSIPQNVPLSPFSEKELPAVDINESKINEPEPDTISSWRKVSPASNRKLFMKQMRGEISDESTGDDSPLKRRKLQKMSQIFHAHTPPKKLTPPLPPPSFNESLNFPDENQINERNPNQLVLSAESPFHRIEKEVTTFREEKKRNLKKRNLIF